MTVRVETTSIPGLLLVHLEVHRDDRGWFKENWRREAMTAAGLPDLGPVQHNIAFNATHGVTRGFHAEPWDKLVSVASGRAFGAWLDLRAGDGFGRVHHLEIDPALTVLVPRGVANAYQALEDGTAYSYLVNDHWRPDATYLAVDPGSVDVPWPVPLDEAVLSDKDRRLPGLDAVSPVAPRRALVTGGGGQLARALASTFPAAHVVGRHQLDITDAAAVAGWPWHEYDVVVNAAAFTHVDDAESPEGRRSAWAVNATGVEHLTAAARAHRLTLVHVSTDYVFDGTIREHTIDEAPSPLGVYGQSKAAGELAARSVPTHYLVRTSWVVGDGPNFVRTMQRLAADGVSPEVVDDQVGRLTFAEELARAVRHLLDTSAPYGTYHVTNGGEPMSWADVAAEVFRLAGRDPADVRRVSTEEWERDHPGAPRPADSTLDLSTLRATGFEPADAREALRAYSLRP